MQYYFLYRQIFNLYHYIYQWNAEVLAGQDPLSTLSLMVPEGFSNARSAHSHCQTLTPSQSVQSVARKTQSCDDMHQP